METTGVPTRFSAAVWRGKVTLLQLQRGVRDACGQRVRCHPCAAPHRKRFPLLIAESRTALWSEESIAERRLQLGKVQNLRCAVRQLHGAMVPAGQVFSFWKQIGRTTARRGYAPGRELREGCVIPSRGGGLCQLSNALYAVAQDAGAEIVERHAHTRVIPGSAAEAGRDATVFWNYRDLRFRFAEAVQIEARITARELIVRLYSMPSPRPKPVLQPATARHPRIVLLDPLAHGCVTCGEETCFRHDSPLALESREKTSEKTAFLLDEVWPEYRRYVQECRSEGDHLAVPLDGARWRLPRYAWETAGFDTTFAIRETLLRALTARRLRGASPSQLRASQLAGAERMAVCLVQGALQWDTPHVCVAQALLPFVWRDGHLGGRTFDVLMTRLPLQILHQRLDTALFAHPERQLLGDFRAPQEIVEAESEALSAAARIITPHAEIAALFPGRATLLPWHLPTMPPLPVKKRCRAIAFPGPTAARKGAYEVREAARALDIEVVLIGSELEGTDFWAAVRTRRAGREGGRWLEGVSAVVQPAIAEDQPRPLLQALAAGVPIIASAACGLGEREGVVTSPAGDVSALIGAIRLCITSEVDGIPARGKGLQVPLK